ncbi:hypothetical protein FKP32DRAFT_1680827 [Trametes sanguinea]|nr:hypothetical protein FKP32DRAFT_1680827 [Trametes sanguinea]
MSTIFPLHLLERYSMPKEVVCSDLELSDRFLDSVNHLSFKLPDRQSSTWGSWKGHSADQSPTTLASLSDRVIDASSSQAATLLPTYDLDLDLQLPFATLDLHDTTHLSTSFDFLAKRNKSQPYPPPGPEREEWTTLEREAAERAPTISDPAELADKLKSFYDPEGVKAPRQYCRIDENIFSQANLKLTASDGSLLLFVAGDLPDYIREALELQLETALGGDDSNPFLRDIQDPKESGQEFSCLHFAFWSRNATQGHNVPRDLHPMTLKQSVKSRTNHHQMMPYLSKELILNQEVYNNLCDAFEDLFIWLERKLRAQLPEFYSELRIVADVLPGHSSAPAYPFTGFVININVSTKAHRDWGDLSGCLVMPIGTFKGGDLCLEEPGLVVPLRSGDMVVFQSHRTTHFNLHPPPRRTCPPHPRNGRLSSACLALLHAYRQARETIRRINQSQPGAHGHPPDGSAEKESQVGGHDRDATVTQESATSPSPAPPTGQTYGSHHLHLVNACAKLWNALLVPKSNKPPPAGLQRLPCALRNAARTFACPRHHQ